MNSFNVQVSINLLYNTPYIFFYLINKKLILIYGNTLYI